MLVTSSLALSSPARRLDCADDADFRVAGVDDDGKAVEWKCADWLTYA